MPSDSMNIYPTQINTWNSIYHGKQRRTHN